MGAGLTGFSSGSPDQPTFVRGFDLALLMAGANSRRRREKRSKGKEGKEALHFKTQEQLKCINRFGLKVEIKVGLRKHKIINI